MDPYVTYGSGLETWTAPPTLASPRFCHHRFQSYKFCFVGPCRVWAEGGAVPAFGATEMSEVLKTKGAEYSFLGNFFDHDTIWSATAGVPVSYERAMANLSGLTSTSK